VQLGDFRVGQLSAEEHHLVDGAVADAALGANYMFLCAPPRGASPFFFLPWPWYIPALEAVGVAVTLLLFLPFAIARRAQPRPRGAGALL